MVDAKRSDSFNSDKQGSETTLNDDNSKLDLENQELEQYYKCGHIDRSDFIIWSVVPAIGIFFCILHAEQSCFWQWIGNNAGDAQSLCAKTIISIISAIIGSCAAATFMKTIIVLSFTRIRYKGARFSQLVSILGGYSPTHIPMLTAGGAWLTIILIVLMLCLSVLTKQMANVSMGITYIKTNSTIFYTTTNFTKCQGIPTTTISSDITTVLGIQVINSLVNPNFTFLTNDYYDQSIPQIQGISKFKRVLPFADVSCHVVDGYTDSTSFDQNRLLLSENKTWGTMLTLSTNDPTGNRRVNCTIVAGHATAVTSCVNNRCYTEKTSNIVSYDNSVDFDGIVPLVSEVFSIMTPSSSSTMKHPILTWLLGGNLATTTTVTTNVSNVAATNDNDVLQVIQNKASILATVCARVLCDRVKTTEMTPLESVVQNDTGYHIYHILWKWPFFVLAGVIFASWLICMHSMWITPECRIISIEWLLSQHITRDKHTYMSGRKIVQAHGNNVFQIADQNPKSEIGTISILEFNDEKYVHNVVNHKSYE